MIPVGSKWYNILTDDKVTVVKCDKSYVTYTKTSHLSKSNNYTRYIKPIKVFLNTYKQWHTQ